MKRIISCLLAILLMVPISVGSSVIAAEDVLTFAVSSEKALPGENVHVTIRIENNPGIASIRMKVHFGDELILNSVDYNDDELGGSSKKPQTLTSPVTLNWFNGAEDTFGNMVYADLDFTVSKDASFGTYPITVSCDENDIFRHSGIDLEKVPFEVAGGGVSVGYIIGDVDFNGFVDIADVTWIQRYIAEYSDFPFTFRIEPADIDFDEDATLIDAIFLQRYLSDLKVQIPVHIGERIE